MPVITAIEFLSACLLLGLGLFLFSEAMQRLRQHLVPAGIAQGLTALGGVATALVGGYWAAIIVRW
ncbi:MAG: hypothetical protein HY784_19440 [Chloroflexi bacterium]|nr:hypothetical protein [Chloroflexota bacterium]